ncbi:MAG: hypothetical protein D3904_17595 [Candidatus Electrothrix sp. EH2]|nr:hypothetical protein [Candidatus Electrothrix sp. EH2]
MEGGRVVQVGTPDDILQNPADDYVHAFFRGVDPAKVITAGEIAGSPKTTVIHQSRGRESPQMVLRQLSGQEADFAYILDPDERFLGIVSADSLQQQLQRPKEEQQLDHAFLRDVRPATVSDSMQNILPEVASNPPLFRSLMNRACIREPCPRRSFSALCTKRSRRLRNNRQPCKPEKRTFTFHPEGVRWMVFNRNDYAVELFTF